ncbi:hypothetical protein QE152_g9154 [Popillia japonica]|uniref:Uncharacterized protein n=1 Tax=Popillia japonica TaxID=7064 RepID=A0AAW1M055_POPJA
MMVRVQRKMLLRVASAVRTVSASAVQEGIAMIPIELMVEERKRLYQRRDDGTSEAKKEERETTLQL